MTVELILTHNSVRNNLISNLGSATRNQTTPPGFKVAKYECIAATSHWRFSCCRVIYACSAITRAIDDN